MLFIAPSADDARLAALAPASVPADPIRAILDRYQEPLFVTGADLRVHFRNSAALRVLRMAKGLTERTGRLSLGSAHADAALQGAMASVDPATRTTRSGSRGIRISRPGSARDWLVLVQCLGEPTDRDATTPVFFIQIIGRTRPRAAPLRLLADLFELTARETAVVTELSRGRDAHEAAQSLKLSTETIRTYLKRIFRKCEVHSQAELLSLLHCVSQFASNG